MLGTKPDDKAATLIEQISTKSLAKSKKVLLQSIEEKPKAKIENKNREKKQDKNET